MILSKFNFHYQKNDYHIIYNSASGNCIVMTDADYFRFVEMKVDTEQQNIYLSMGFYVSKNTDEVQNLLTTSDQVLKGSKRTKLRILTTTACNAFCPYCYEMGIEHKTMSHHTAHQVAEFVLAQSTNSKLLAIEWFGGEPLLNSDVIDIICHTIQQKKSPDLKFESSIITNGFFIDNDIVQKMQSLWNICQVQITLDGTEQEYERIKGMGTGSFNKVLSNIEKLCYAKIKTVIRLNYDSQNMEEMKDLICFLSTLPYKDYLEVYPAKLFGTRKEGTFSLENETLQMYRLLHQYGFKTQINLLPKTIKTPCAAVFPKYYTINADGSLFKCDRKFLPQNIIGNVFSPDKIDKTKIKKWETFQLPAHCYPCKLLPLCWGGCIYERVNGQDYCYTTEKIILNNLSMILDDYLKCVSEVNS